MTKFQTPENKGYISKADRPMTIAALMGATLIQSCYSWTITWYDTTLSILYLLLKKMPVTSPPR